ncbi:hypothetical protein V8E53_004085 [Lactarius tabidus]
MSYLAILVISFFATLSLASPVARQTSLCPSNGTPNASNFTLLAVSKTDPSVQTPLALGSNGLTDDSTSYLGTADSIVTIVAEDFDMVDGGVTAYAPDGSFVGASKAVPSPNGLLSFQHPYGNIQILIAQIYCELFNTSPHGVPYPYALAVNGGDSDSFSLCQSSTSDEVLVIYNAAEAGSTDAGFDWTTCTPVFVNIIFPVDQ